MAANISVMPFSECEKRYKFFIDTQLCAGNIDGGINACSGDSGGPLVCKNKLCGIVSYGKRCGKKGYPGVYTEVSNYINWVKATNKSLYVSTSVSLDIAPGLFLIILGKCMFDNLQIIYQLFYWKFY